MKATLKKGVMGEIIGVFVLILVISVLAGMTFLFTSQLKSQIATQVGAGYPNATSYVAVNATENAGATVINYLPLLFLAIIFGAILAVVLKIILPYINLGNQVGGF